MPSSSRSVSSTGSDYAPEPASGTRPGRTLPSLRQASTFSASWRILGGAGCEHEGSKKTYPQCLGQGWSRLSVDSHPFRERPTTVSNAPGSIKNVISVGPGVFGKAERGSSVSYRGRVDNFSTTGGSRCGISIHKGCHC